MLFVSHNMALIQTLCRRGILFANGSIVTDAGIEEAVTAYLGTLETLGTTDLADRTDRGGAGQIRATSLDISSTGGDGSLVTGRPARFAIHVTDLAADLALLDHDPQPRRSAPRNLRQHGRRYRRSRRSRGGQLLRVLRRGVAARTGSLSRRPHAVGEAARSGPRRGGRVLRGRARARARAPRVRVRQRRHRHAQPLVPTRRFMSSRIRVSCTSSTVRSSEAPSRQSSRCSRVWTRRGGSSSSHTTRARRWRRSSTARMRSVSRPGPSPRCIRGWTGVAPNTAVRVGAPAAAARHRARRISPGRSPASTRWQAP